MTEGSGWLWLAAALLLALGELLVPGVFLIFLAAAAAITGTALLVLPDLPPAAQIASFTAWSAAAVLIGRRWYRDYPVPVSDAHLNDRAARMTGDVALLETAIERGRGRVIVGDGSWPARGPDLPAGARVRIVAVDHGIVVVEPAGDPPAGSGLRTPPA